VTGDDRLSLGSPQTHAPNPSIFSSGNTDRPALQRLLEDVRAGKIDIIVVYKVGPSADPEEKRAPCE
jgi:hypothetical protein